MRGMAAEGRKVHLGTSYSIRLVKIVPLMHTSLCEHNGTYLSTLSLSILAEEEGASIARVSCFSLERMTFLLLNLMLF